MRAAAAAASVPAWPPPITTTSNRLMCHFYLIRKVTHQLYTLDLSTETPSTCSIQLTYIAEQLYAVSREKHQSSASTKRNADGAVSAHYLPMQKDVKKYDPEHPQYQYAQGYGIALMWLDLNSSTR